MSGTQPQPPGGGALDIDSLRAAMTEASLIVHNPPDIPIPSQVLGICAVPEEYADQHKYGWMVADFLAWKTLLYHVGAKTAQTWLSSLDISMFLENIGLEDEGSIPKVLGTNNDHITQLSSDPKEFATALYEYIGDRAKVADEQKTTLFIMIFGPVTPEQDLCVDFDGRKAFITTSKIREVIRNAVNHDTLPVVLMTPSPFTGGWMCRPSLFVPSSFTWENMMRTIAKSCGAAFADSLVDLYSTKSSPLLSAEQRSKFKYDDIMPIWPTDAQRNLFHMFKRKVHETLGQRMAVLGAKHCLNMDANKDAWAVLARRKGRSLVDFWAKKWTAPEVMDIDGVDRYPFLGEAFGGTRASQTWHIQYLAGNELATCPRDWSSNTTGITKDLFSGFLKNDKPNEETIKRVFDAIEFRASSMILAQVLVNGLSLPIPKGVKCRYWLDMSSVDGYLDDTFYHKFQLAFSNVHNLFDQIAVFPGERRHDFKHVRFLRPSRWLAAAIAAKFTDASDQKITDFIRKSVAPLIQQIRGTQTALLLENPSVTRLGFDWIASLEFSTRIEPAPGETSDAMQLDSDIEPKATAPLQLAVVSSPSECVAASKDEMELESDKGLQEEPVSKAIDQAIEHKRRRVVTPSEMGIDAERSAKKPGPRHVEFNTGLLSKPAKEGFTMPIFQFSPGPHTTRPDTEKRVDAAPEPTGEGFKKHALYSSMNPLVEQFSPKKVVDTVWEPLEKPGVLQEVKSQVIHPTRLMLTPRSVLSKRRAEKFAAEANKNKKLPEKPMEQPVATTIGKTVQENSNQLTEKCVARVVCENVEVRLKEPIEKSAAEDIDENVHTTLNDIIEEPEAAKVVTDTINNPVAPGTGSDAGMLSSALATMDINTLMGINPTRLALVLAKAMELLKLEEAKKESAANNAAGHSGGGNSFTSTADVSANKAATIASANNGRTALANIAANTASNHPNTAAIRTVTGNSNAVPGGGKGQAHDGVLLVRPTPPVTPTGGRVFADNPHLRAQSAQASGNEAPSGSKTRTTQSAQPNRRLLSTDKFWDNVKW